MGNKIIKKIEITDFRSIKTLNLDCTEYNLFCGLNDSGKSNVLKALNLFFNNQTDFLESFDFSLDYNKFALAEAQGHQKKKQLISIRITFFKPEGYKSIKKNTFWVKKTYDRNTKNGPYLIEYSEKGTAKNLISRFLNKTHYVYLPALKGKNVIQYILSLLGEQQLITPNQIGTLNQTVNKNLRNLGGILRDSNVCFDAVFELPRLLRDFWEKLAINTTNEYFDEIKNKSGSTKIVPDNYQIPLLLRGDGMKTKFLPAALVWLQQNNINDYYIWGIDEPENSLEFKAASDLSDLYCNNYAKEVQIFATSHSMAFLNPPSNAEISPSIYRVNKNEMGSSEYIRIEDFLTNSSASQKTMEEIGVFEVQRNFIEKYRADLEEKENIISQLKSKIGEMTKPTIITEGKTDWKHLKAALDFFKANGEFEDIEVQIVEYDFDFGDSKLHDLLNKYKTFSNSHRIIGVFDCDESNGNTIHSEGGIKEFGNNVYAMSLPIPEFRTYNQGGISIEFLYEDSDLKKKDQNGRRIFVTSEFNSDGRLVTDLKIGVKNYYDVKKYTQRSKEKIKADDVVDITGKSLALSKEQFALNILNKTNPFNNMDFNAFKPVFERLREVLSKS